MEILRRGSTVEYRGIVYTVLSADDELALVHDPSINEYGVYDGTELLIYNSKEEAEHELAR